MLTYTLHSFLLLTEANREIPVANDAFAASYFSVCSDYYTGLSKIDVIDK